MTYQISFSGGLGSAISALIAHRNGLDFNLIFADTLIEDEDLYRFMSDVADRVGVEVIHLKDGRTPWDVYVDKRWIGNTRTAHCSTELKTKPVRAWLDENAAPDDPLVLGMDWSEQDRIVRAAKVWEPRPVISLLNEYQVTRADYAQWLSDYDLQQPRLYGMGFSHNNCFHGDTKLITSDGIKTLKECAGSEITVLGRASGWKPATVRSFGTQRIWELELSRFGRKKVIQTTADHRWFVRQTRDRQEEVLTKDLPIGKRLVGAYGRLSASVRPSAFGIAHGIVFGDGTAVSGTWNNPAKIMLCGAKNEPLLKWFPNSPCATVDGVGIEVRDLPRFWKQPPDYSESQSYLYGWLSGYFAADGSYSGGEATISSASYDNLLVVSDVCAKLGIPTGPIRQESRKGYGDVATPLYCIPISPWGLRDDFFLVESHLATFKAVSSKRPAEWMIERVTETNRDEEVFCAVVPDGRAFALEGNILTGNCGGFCCKAGQVQFERLYRAMPERYEHHASEMERVMAEIGPTARPFLRQTDTSGELQYLTLREYADHLDRGTMELPMFSEEGCGCFTDE